ncbi:MAG: hypothetical protein J6I53_12495 [Treponema sp.]|nr:hypothetical protein [Treponema sp.]
MSETVRRINNFFRFASKSEIDRIRENIVLSERQEKIFDMYYIKKQGRGFISDTLFTSQSTVSGELRQIRIKLVKFL